MIEWIQQNELLLWALGGFSVACLILSVVAIPALIIRLPADYFAGTHRRSPEPSNPALHLTLTVLRNLLGALLVIAGISMLVLPGQGILTILVGLFLMRFPGKYRLERRIAQQPAVLRAINWIWEGAGVPPLSF